MKWLRGLGVLLLIVLVVLSVSWLARIRFQREAHQEMNALFSELTKCDEEVKETDLAGLPDCVQLWLQRAGVVGRPHTQNVRVQQTATMRLSEAGA